MTVTIALSAAEGVVLGTDSTTTISVTNPSEPDQPLVAQLFNSAQKIFEIGPRLELERFVPGETFSGGLATWGDGTFGPISWRNVVSEFYCRMIRGSNNWEDIPAQFRTFTTTKWQELKDMGVVEPATPIPDAGFMVGAIGTTAHEVHAGEVCIRSGEAARIERGDIRVGGDEATVSRIINGYDQGLLPVLDNAGFDVEAFKEHAQAVSISPFIHHMPLRDAIDFVHFLIYSTIKLHRYRGGACGCGGAD